LSELGVVIAGFEQDLAWVGLAILALLAATFAGMCRHVVGLALGRPIRPIEPAKSNPVILVALAPLAVAVVMLGVWIPSWLSELIHQAAITVGTASFR
jgi:formate hydrogenlyase subunit 3/multisubunit Na+/H+ antiporter MnhD subunit